MLRFGSGTYNLRDSEENQPKVNGASPELVCSVFFLDDSEHKFQVSKNAAGDDLFQQVVSYLELSESDFFGLQFVCVTGSDTVRLKWLDSKKSIKRQMMCPPYHLFFRLKFYVSDPGKLVEEYTRYLVYLQLRKDLLGGRLPCADDLALELGGLAAQAELGDSLDSDAHHLDNFRFLPRQTSGLMAQIAQRHHTLQGKSAAEAEFEFLDRAKCLDFYGFDLYEAQDDYDRPITIGVNSNGVSVFDNGSRVHSFPWAAIIKVSFKRKNFLLSIVTMDPSEEAVNTELSFNALTAQNCKMLWKSCIEHHTFFRLAAPPATSAKSVFHLGSRFRYSGRTEHQTVENSKRFGKPERSFTRVSVSNHHPSPPTNAGLAEQDSDADLVQESGCPEGTTNGRRRRRFVESARRRTTSLLHDNPIRRKLSQKMGTIPGSAGHLLQSLLAYSAPGFKPNDEQPLKPAEELTNGNGVAERASSHSNSVDSSLVPPDPSTSAEEHVTEDVNCSHKSERLSCLGPTSNSEIRAKPYGDIPPALTTSLHSLGLDELDASTSEILSLANSLSSATGRNVRRRALQSPSTQEHYSDKNGDRLSAEPGVNREAASDSVHLSDHSKPRPVRTSNAIRKPVIVSAAADHHNADLRAGTASRASYHNGTANRPPIPLSSRDSSVNARAAHPPATDFPAAYSACMANNASQRRSMTSVEHAPYTPLPSRHHHSAVATSSRAASPHAAPLIRRPSSISPPSSLSNGEERAVAVRMQPDLHGRFGFNVSGGADCTHPVIVSRIIAGSPADRCAPRLNVGDQVLRINEQDIAKWPYASVVNYIRSARAFGPMTMHVMPNVYRCGGETDASEAENLVPETPHVSETVPRSEKLVQSLNLLKESMESRDIVAQFEKLYRTKSGMTMDASHSSANMSKNRYLDVRPYDATRVVLEKAPSGDYVNASHVNMDVPSTGIVNRYIATQGPLPNTCGDFWYMVWEQCSTTVVMLTTIVENDRVKCHQYWPDQGETLEFGNLMVSNLSERNDPYCQYRELSVRNKLSREERRVTQMQYTAWPDHGVPENSTHFIDFVGEVRRARNGSLDPIIVHCSAGIGRTGVLILMETAACLIESNEPVYPLDIVRTMRDQRAMLIQTTEQYTFVCECILRAYCGQVIKPLAEYQKSR